MGVFIEIVRPLCYNRDMGVRVKAYAKLNLTLAVTGVKDGMHTLDSLVCSVDMCDVVTAKRRADGKINVVMRGLGSENIPYGENNAVKAARLYAEEFSTCGADITIDKNIPMGAGLGGSSADAAGVLNAMDRLYGACGREELFSLACRLGSDTGYMLTGGYALLGGWGEKVVPVDCGARLDLLLLVPERGVSTAECYRGYDRCPSRCGGSEAALAALISGDKTALGASLNNALYGAAKGICGDVERAFSDLKGFSPLGVNMTGSGSGVYALFDSAEMCAWAKSRYRGNARCYILKTV